MFVETGGDYEIGSWFPSQTLRQGDCGFQFHILGNFLDVVLLDASEDAREDQGIVDLVLEVTAAAAVDEGAVGLGLFREDFGGGVGEREDNGLFGHFGDPFAFQSACRRHADENIRFDDDSFERSR